MNLYLQLIRLDFKKYFPSKASFFAPIIASLGSLFIFFYTSKAFGNQFENLGMSYFTFILSAEVALYSASLLLVFPLEQLKQWKNRGVLDYILSTPTSILKIFILRSFATIPRSLFFIFLQLFMAIIFFDFQLSVSDFLVLTLFPFVGFALFLSLGLIAMSTFLITGRGASSIGYLTTFISIFSGAYFPLNVLPNWLSSIGLLSPYAILINSVRSFLLNGSIGPLMESSFLLLSWSVVSFIVSFCLLRLALKVYKSNPNRFTFDL